MDKGVAINKQCVKGERVDTTSKEGLWGILMSGSYQEKPGLSLQLGAALFQTDSRRDATVLLFDLGTHDAPSVGGEQEERTVSDRDTLRCRIVTSYLGSVKGF